MILAFHLGRVYTLSFAEVLGLLSRHQVPYTILEFYTEMLVIETAAELDLASLQKRLGGVIKIIEVLDTIPRKKRTDFISFTTRPYFTFALLKEKFLASYSGKVQFGVSLYPVSAQTNLYGQNKRVGMEIKNTLTEAGVSCRLVLPEGASSSLPSVAVTNNRLLEKGVEIDLLVSDKKIYVGKTLSVQDFADYGRRDYQRPSRDARAGMLPPKVAQMMINIATHTPEEREKRAYVLDPFAGAGTLLQEALLMGFKVLGSDISQEAVDSAEKNLNWFRIRYKLSPGLFQVFKSDVGKVSEGLEGKQPIAIVTEGTLGPIYVHPPTQKEIDKNFQNLSKIFVAAFKEFKKILAPGRSVVMAFPGYKLGNKYTSFPDIDKILKLGYDIQALIPHELQKTYPFLKVTPRGSIIYDRKDQIVVREIIHFIVK